MAFLSSLQNLLPFTPYAYRGAPVVCNLCGSARSLVVCRHDRRLKKLTSVACEDCGLIRMDPMPTNAELTAYYASEYRRDYQFAFSKTPPRFHLVGSARDAAARLQYLQPVLKPGSRFFDFGSGSGEFLSLMKQGGHKVLGLEPGQDFAAFSRDRYGVEVIAREWGEVELPSGGFDVITAHHVLEHLREPVSALRKLAEWLADDGVIYLAVPNALAPHAQTFQLFHFAHVHNFTPQALVLAAEAAGLELDPRVSPQGTMAVFRKRPVEKVPPARPVGLGIGVAATFDPSSPLAFLASGRWIVDAVRRLRKTISDGRGKLPAKS